MPGANKSTTVHSTDRSGDGDAHRPAAPATTGQSAARRPDPQVLDRLVRELSLRERLVICLRHADGLSISEIAVVLEVGTTEIERVLEHVARRVRLAAGLATA